MSLKRKGKGFPYSIPSVGPGADPGVQAVSSQVTVSHPPGGRLPLLFARPAVTFPATQHHSPLAGTKLYCLVTEAHRCEQLAQGCYTALPGVGFKPVTCWSQVQRSTYCAPVLSSCYFVLVICLDFRFSFSLVNDNSMCFRHFCHRFCHRWRKKYWLNHISRNELCV